LGDMGNFESLLEARDLWDKMTELSRLAYLQALAEPLARKHGGDAILTRIMDSDESLEGVVAASLLARPGSPASGFAASRLLRALHEGTRSEKLLALVTLPPGNPEVQRAMLELAQSDDVFLRTAALELLLKSATHADQALKRLHTIAASKDADAYEASRVLALRGDEPSIVRVERQLGAPHAADRLGAARLLLKIKRWTGVARALTDDHPAVRLAMACDVWAG